MPINDTVLRLPYIHCTTCLTNHMGSISCRIMILVINSYRGRHTHAYILALRTKSILRNQVFADLQPACARLKAL